MNTESNVTPGSAVESPASAPPAIPATRRMYWAVRREVWENRSIYLAPLAVAGKVQSTVVVPLQDVLGLGSEARMNTPSVPKGNWEFRLGDRALSAELAQRLGAVAAARGTNRDDMKGIKNVE